jgi:predicted nucleotidyltransferase
MYKEIIEEKIKESIKHVSHKEAINKVALFGSYLHDNPTEASDVDILIEFVPNAKIGFFQMSDILRNLEGSLQKKVDLVTPDALSRHFRDEVLSEVETLYERKQ